MIPICVCGKINYVFDKIVKNLQNRLNKLFNLTKMIEWKCQSNVVIKRWKRETGYQYRKSNLIKFVLKPKKKTVFTAWWRVHFYWWKKERHNRTHFTDQLRVLFFCYSFGELRKAANDNNFFISRYNQIIHGMNRLSTYILLSLNAKHYGRFSKQVW